MWTFYNSNGEALVQHAESEATQTEIEGETAVAKFVPPDLVKHSPGVAKVRWNGNSNLATMAEHESYGMDSFTDNAVGIYTFTFDTAFSSVNFSWFASAGHIQSGGLGIIINQYDTDATARTTTTLKLHLTYGHYTSGPLSGHNFTDVDVNELDLIVFGDQ